MSRKIFVNNLISKHAKVIEIHLRAGFLCVQKIYIDSIGIIFIQLKNFVQNAHKLFV